MADVRDQGEEAEARQVGATTLLDRGKLEFLLKELDSVSAVPGMLFEVGCYKGGTLLLLSALAPGRRCLGFDTFEGLPGLTPEDKCEMQHEAGDFADVGTELIEQMALRGIPILKKRFPHGVPDVPVAFCHLDIDLYEGTAESLSYLARNLVPGGRVVLDDYEFPRTPGIAIAVTSFLASHPEFEVAGHAPYQISLRRLPV